MRATSGQRKRGRAGSSAGVECRRTGGNEVQRGRLDNTDVRPDVGALALAYSVWHDDDVYGTLILARKKTYMNPLG